MQHLGFTWNRYLSFKIQLEFTVNCIYVNCMQIITWYNEPLQLAASKEWSDSKTKAIDFLKLIRSWDVIAMALFLWDLWLFYTKLALSSRKVTLQLQTYLSVCKYNFSICIISIFYQILKKKHNRTNFFAHSNGPFLQKLSQFEICHAPSAGATSRNTYKLTGGNRLQGFSNWWHWASSWWHATSCGGWRASSR